MNASEIMAENDRPFFLSSKLYYTVRPIVYQGIPECKINGEIIGWEMCIVNDDNGHVYTSDCCHYETKEKAIKALKRLAKIKGWRKVK